MCAPIVANAKWDPAGPRHPRRAQSDRELAGSIRPDGLTRASELVQYKSPNCLICDSLRSRRYTRTLSCVRLCPGPGLPTVSPPPPLPPPRAPRASGPPKLPTGTVCPPSLIHVQFDSTAAAEHSAGPGRYARPRHRRPLYSGIVDWPRFGAVLSMVFHSGAQ